MNGIIEFIKKNEQLFLENAEELDGEGIEQENLDEYLALQGVTEEELNAFENQFQIRLPEDFKTVYRYKNGSGYMNLIWPQTGFYRGYRLLSLQEMSEIKS
jgi:cell wall assembly regulator SMI1